MYGILVLKYHSFDTKYHIQNQNSYSPCTLKRSKIGNLFPTLWFFCVVYFLCCCESPFWCIYPHFTVVNPVFPLADWSFLVVSSLIHSSHIWCLAFVRHYEEDQGHSLWAAQPLALWRLTSLNCSSRNRTGRTGAGVSCYSPKIMISSRHISFELLKCTI